MTCVLSFDLATNSGWALVQPREHRGANDPDYEVLEAGTLATPLELDPIERLAWLAGQVEGVMDRLLELHTIDLIAWECVPAVYKGVFQVALQNQQYGAFLSAISKYGIHLVSYAPTTWQRQMLPYIPGRRTLKSSAVRKLLKRHSMDGAWQRAGFAAANDNESDACLVGIYALREAELHERVKEAMAR